MKRSLVLLFVLLIGFAPAQAATLPVEEVTSAKGIKAWLVRDDKLPLISMQFAFRGGVEQDAPAKQGLTELAVALMTQGAGDYDAEAFQQKLADQSIQLGFDAGRDALYGKLKTLRPTRAEAFRLLGLALTKPRFDADALERARQQQLTALRFEISGPAWQARRALFDSIFGDHPYALRHYGTAKTLAGLTRADIRNFAQTRFARDNLLVAVVGDISAEELAKALDEVFGALPAKASLAPIKDAPWPATAKSVLVKRMGTQTTMLFALPMPRRTDPDWYAAEIANYVLGGGGFVSRLMNEVRSKEGLTYGISTGLAPMERAALLVGQASTDNPKVGRAWDLTRSVWQTFYTKGASEADITAAKDYLTGSLSLQLTSTSSIAAVLLEMQEWNLGRDYLDRRNALIRKVAAQDVHRVIQRWFNPANLALAAVGAPEGLNVTETREQATE